MPSQDNHNGAKIRPLQGQVLLKMEPADVSDGGIVIPEAYRYPNEGERRRTANYGRVVRCGIWRQRRNGALIPYEVQAGQLVVIDGRSGRWFKSENLGLKVVDANSILAVIEQPA